MSRGASRNDEASFCGFGYLCCEFLRFFWLHQLIRKWFNIEASGDEFSADEDEFTVECDDKDSSRTDEKEPSYSDKKEIRNLKGSYENNVIHKSLEVKFMRQNVQKQLKICVGTWNVAGRVPSNDVTFQDWLCLTNMADIYVIGFQEIVPLNASNILCMEDVGPTITWDALIRQVLNDKSAIEAGKICAEGDNLVVGNLTGPFTYAEVKSGSVENNEGSPIRSYESFDSHDNINEDETLPLLSSSLYCSHGQYVRIASKQMVGIYLTVWIRQELRYAVSNLLVSCIGRGIMGYLGNKGAISISMLLYQTSFCFICSHLTSGDNEGDLSRRNADVIEILRKTNFTRPSFLELPNSILDHDRVIWFGDLNYRLNVPNTELQFLLAKKDWESLLQRDQLRMEQNAGRVFRGWQEGSIKFAPTYKYLLNSNMYAEETLTGHKNRAPAWCDRILWIGKGMKQLAYVRAESTLSDHRPVSALFVVEVGDGEIS